jgi:CheY-like chemotaxis protein
MTTENQPFVILLAEDEPADAHLVKVAIAENHILADLHHVSDGREALDYLQHQGARFADAPRPDLILLDLNMPRMDGREFLAAIKQLPDLRDIPVVVVTTSEVERDVVASYGLGAAGYITKPVDVVQFMAVIRDLGNYWIDLVRLPKNPGGAGQ